MNELILGPQSPLTDSWFDTTQVSMARMLGQQCPPTPPTDPAQLDSYAKNLHYYDLAKSQYIVAARRGNDPEFLAYARNAADSWWQHPWIGKGTFRPWPDNATPPPRHVGLGGLILRALDDKPEYWDFCVEYTRTFLNIYMLWRLNNEKLHVDIREGAFTFHYATWLAKVLPDSYPKQSGGMETNGAAIRAQFHTDLEKITIQYYERLQKTSPCGACWLYDAPEAVGFTQAFTAGLLLLAFADFHQITTNATVRESLKGMILRAARHLYADGPYRLNDPVPYDPRIRWRCFWYLWHGGTLTNPTAFEKGGWSLPGNNKSEVQDGRQSIGPVVAIYGYAYKISNDPFFLEALKELWDSAYGATDGVRNYMNTDGKGLNQNCARAGSAWPWAGMTPMLPPTLPKPPDPPIVPDPPILPPPTGTMPVINIVSPANGATISVKTSVTISITDPSDISEIYLIVDDKPLPMKLGSPYLLDTMGLTDGTHVLSVRAWKGGMPIDSKEKISVVVKNTVVPPPPIDPPPIDPPPPVDPPPMPKPCSIIAPASIDIPRNGFRDISIRLDGLTEPTTVTVSGWDGQVSVLPTSKIASPPSATLSFRVKVKNKRMSKILKFRCSCGEREVKVNVV